MAEHIALDLPLRLRHASTVRAVAAALGADAGFSVDAIDDLRLGVNEAISVLCDVDPAVGGADARLTVRFTVDRHTVGAVVERHGVGEPVGELDALASRILRAVVDEFAIDDGVVTVVKRVAGDVDVH